MENQNDDRGKYWPWMILGFVFIGITLGFWTVKSAIKMPVYESNEYMMKYQTADKDANNIKEAQKLFDSRYNIELVDMNLSDFKPKFLKRKIGDIVALSSINSIKYKITDKDGNIVEDMNVTLLLTRPHTQTEDQLFENVKLNGNYYQIDNLVLKSEGRYILRVRASKDKAVGFKDTEAYYKK